jgi:hypothetical protein
MNYKEFCKFVIALQEPSHAEANAYGGTSALMSCENSSGGRIGTNYVVRPTSMGMHLAVPEVPKNAHKPQAFEKMTQRNLRSADLGRNKVARKCRIRVETPARTVNVLRSVRGYVIDFFGSALAELVAHNFASSVCRRGCLETRTSHSAMLAPCSAYKDDETFPHTCREENMKIDEDKNSLTRLELLASVRARDSQRSYAVIRHVVESQAQSPMAAL